MSDVWGGGLVVSAAAALWLVYLIPTWLRRREYLATERNAVRLQQTLRILAETSEIPGQVRMEATARTVAEQQRRLREVEARAAAVARAEAEATAAQEALAAAQATARARAQADAARAAMPVPSEPRAAVLSEPRMPVAAGAQASARRRLRRARATTSLVLLCALLTAGYGLYAGLLGESWLVLGVAAVSVAVSVVVLGRLARMGRRAAAPAPVAAPTAVELFDHADHHVQQTRTTAPTWTPRPLPKPLHLSRGTIAASAMASMDAAAELRRKTAASELERRAAELAPVLPRVRPAASVPQETVPQEMVPQETVPRETASRFASMGIVDEAGGASIDLDAALRRRRAAS